jgi:hypothetical protein
MSRFKCGELEGKCKDMACCGWYTYALEFFAIKITIAIPALRVHEDVNERDGGRSRSLAALKIVAHTHTQHTT